MHTVRFTLCLLALLCLFAGGAAAAPATTDAALNGTWRIDVDKTFTVNANWKRAYEGSSPEARTAMRAGWEKRILIIDLTNRLFTQQGQDGKIHRFGIENVQTFGHMLRMTAKPREDDPFTVGLELTGQGLLRFTAGESSIILKREGKPE